MEDRAVNAFSLPALAMARRNAAALPARFEDLARRSVPPGIVRLESTGRATGLGPGVYIADAKATPDLLAEHPGFVFATRNGRIFRLLDEAGAITVEQGGATGDGESDDRDAIQATIEYAEAIGAGIVRFGQARYRLHCPIRLSPAAATRATDGHPLIIRRSLRLEGRSGAQTVLDFAGPNGGDPATDYQLVATSDADPTPAVWRGGGLFIDGDAPRPVDGPLAIERIELARLAFHGNRTRSGLSDWPADPATGQGWDTSDKAFWLQDCHAGDIVLTDTDLIGWGGEIFYLGGSPDAVRSVTLERCRFLTSDGTAFNPGVNARILARDCEFGDAYQGQEETGKTSARYVNCLWRDCSNVGIGSGPTAAPQYNFAYPTRDPAGPLPLTELENCSFRSVSQILVASWVRGRITIVDSKMIMDTTIAQAARDVDLEVEAWLDRGEGLTALTIHGPANLTTPVGGAPDGVYRQPPKNVRFRIRHYRTEVAEAAGQNWRSFVWSGYIHRSCRIECSGDYTNGFLPRGETNPISMPFVSMEGGVPNPAYAPEGGLATSPLVNNAQIVPASPIMAMACANDELIDCSVKSSPSGGADYGYAPRQTLRLIKSNDTGQIRFTKNAQPWNYEMTQTRVLTKRHDWIEFVYNPNFRRWDETAFFTSA